MSFIQGNSGFGFQQVPSGLTTVQPVITTGGTTNIYYGPGTFPPAPVVREPEPSPLAWLRDQVDEICEMARAA